MNLFNLAVHVSLWMLSAATTVLIIIVATIIGMLGLLTSYHACMAVMGFILGSWVSSRFKTWSYLLAKEFDRE